MRYSAKIAPRVSILAEIFAADMNTVLGVQIPVAVNNGGNIILSLDTTLGKEEYKLTVTKKKIAIVGGSYAGVFYGFQTLKQLLNDGNIPAVIYTNFCD